MNRYIDADTLKHDIQIASQFDEDTNIDLELDQIFELIDKQPTVDAEEVKHGLWIEDGYFDEELVCSNCGTPAIIDANMQIVESSYCPHCGAKMDMD